MCLADKKWIKKTKKTIKTKQNKKKKTRPSVSESKWSRNGDLITCFLNCVKSGKI